MTQLIGSIIALASGAVLWQLLRWMARRLERRRLTFAPRLLRVLARAMLWYGIAVAIVFALPLLDGRIIHASVRERAVLVGLTLLTAVIVAELLREVLRARMRGERASPLAASFVQTVVYAAIYVLAAVVALGILGVKVTALIAAIGAGGLVIGLALQETLANFFAGLYILLTGKFRVGDYIVLDSFEGTVEDITWRTTLIRRGTNAILIVPNQRMSSSVLTVYRAEQSPVIVRVELMLEPAANLERAEQVVLSALGELISSGTVDGLLAEPAPMVRYGDSTRNGVRMTVWVAARNYPAMFLVRSEVLRTCVAALQRAEIPLLVLRG